MAERCKFCKHGYGYFENGKYKIHCNLSYFEYPIEKAPQDTCENFEEDTEEGK